MSTFEEKLKEYNDKLKLHPELIEGINNNKTNTKRAKELLFNPANDIELLLADKITTFFIDAISLFRHTLEIDTPRFEDNRVLDFYLSLMKAFKDIDSEEIFRIRNEIINFPPEEAAEEMFNLTVIMFKNPFKVEEYLQEKSCFDDQEEFKKYFDQVSGYMKGLNVVERNFEEVLKSPELLDYTSRFVDSFDLKYQRTISKVKSNQKQKSDDVM